MKSAPTSHPPKKDTRPRTAKAGIRHIVSLVILVSALAASSLLIADIVGSSVSPAPTDAQIPPAPRVVEAGTNRCDPSDPACADGVVGGPECTLEPGMDALDGCPRDAVPMSSSPAKPRSGSQGSGGVKRSAEQMP